MEILTDEQREIAKLEIQLDVCKRDKDALRYQLSESKRKAAQQSVQLTALRHWFFGAIALNVLSWSIVVAMYVGGN